MFCICKSPIFFCYYYFFNSEYKKIERLALQTIDYKISNLKMLVKKPIRYVLILLLHLLGIIMLIKKHQ